MNCTFHGVLGKHPTRNAVPNVSKTACVSVETADFIIIFDAGTGIIDCGLNFKHSAKPIFLCFSHFHHDHVIGLPHFYHLFKNATTIKFVHPDPKKLKDVFKIIFSPTFFPLGLTDFSCDYDFISPAQCMSYGVHLETIDLNHPGGSYGYSLHVNNETIVYATDHEIIGNDAGLTKFLNQASVYIADSYFFEEPTTLYKGWGHSNVDDIFRISLQANVKDVRLFHHMPERDISFFNRLDAYVSNYLTTHQHPFACSIAKEGDTITFD